MSKQGGNAGENKENLYNREGLLQLEFAVASTVTPANITCPNQFVLDVNLDDIDDLSKVPLALLRGQKHSAVERLLKKRRERNEDLIQFLFQSAIAKTLDGINMNIKIWQDQMELILVELAAQQELLDRLSIHDVALYEAISEFQQTGSLNRNDRGELNNVNAHAALVAYLEKSNISAYQSRNDTELYDLLLDARADVEQQSFTAGEHVIEITRSYEKYKLNVEQSLAIKDDLESDDPVRQQAGLLAYSELEKRLQLEIRQQMFDANEGAYNEVLKPLEEEQISEGIPVIDILGEVAPFPEEAPTSNTVHTPKR